MVAFDVAAAGFELEWALAVAGLAAAFAAALSAAPDLPDVPADEPAAGASDFADWAAAEVDVWDVLAVPPVGVVVAFEPGALGVAPDAAGDALEPADGTSEIGTVDPDDFSGRPVDASGLVGLASGAELFLSPAVPAAAAAAPVAAAPRVDVLSDPESPELVVGGVDLPGAR